MCTKISWFKKKKYFFLSQIRSIYLLAANYVMNVREYWATGWYIWGGTRPSNPFPIIISHKPCNRSVYSYGNKYKSLYLCVVYSLFMTCAQNKAPID